jgi:hypothetical protein
MIVRLGICPDHGRQETALVEPNGLRRCAAPSLDGPCGRPLFEASDFDQELLTVRREWPARREVLDG